MSDSNETRITQPRVAIALRQIEDLLVSQINGAKRFVTKKHYRSDIDTVCVAAHVGPTLVGGLVGHGPRPHLTEIGPIDDVTRRVRVISEVAVLPDYRRHGVGHALVEYAENEFRKSGAALILAFVDDESFDGAGPFWGRVGYTECVPIEKRKACPPGALPREAGLYQRGESTRAGRFFVKHLD